VLDKTLEAWEAAEALDLCPEDGVELGWGWTWVIPLTNARD
jgi:hypothetical protein